MLAPNALEATCWPERADRGGDQPGGGGLPVGPGDQHDLPPAGQQREQIRLQPQADDPADDRSVAAAGQPGGASGGTADRGGQACAEGETGSPGRRAACAHRRPMLSGRGRSRSGRRSRSVSQAGRMMPVGPGQHDLEPARVRPVARRRPSAGPRSGSRAAGWRPRAAVARSASRPARPSSPSSARQARRRLRGEAMDSVMPPERAEPVPDPDAGPVGQPGQAEVQRRRDVVQPDLGAAERIQPLELVQPAQLRDDPDRPGPERHRGLVQHPGPPPRPTTEVRAAGS